MASVRSRVTLAIDSFIHFFAKKRILVIFIALLLLAITVIVIIAIIPLSSLLEKLVIPLSLFWFARFALPRSSCDHQ